MNGSSPVEAILKAIAALAEADRQQLLRELQRQGYWAALDPKGDRPRSKLPPPPLAAPVGAAAGTPAAAHRLQFGDGPDGLLWATVAGWEGCKSFGRDRLEAVQNLICLLGAQAADGDLIAFRPAAGEVDIFDSEAARRSRDYQQVLGFLESYQQRLAAAAED